MNFYEWLKRKNEVDAYNKILLKREEEPDEKYGII